MPDKWSRPRSLGELQNQSYDLTYRIAKTAPYGWDGSSMVQLKVDSNGILSVQQGYTNMGDGRKVVSTAGSAETLASSTACKRVTIMAETDNTGYIVVGSSTVVAAQGTRRGIPLMRGQSITIDIDNLADIYLDTTVNGDGVTYIYFS